MLFVVFKSLLLVSVLSLGCFGTLFFVAAQLPQSEVDALNQIAKTMGAIDWIFDGNACGFTKKPASETDSETNITCTNVNNTPHIMTMDLEANQFSGTVPAQFGKLINLQQLRLSSNRLSGNLPIELAELKNLTQFRINDNNFNGSIPEFIQNWKGLKRLEIQGSGLEGPIPSSISVLKNLEQLRIGDISGTNQAFPELANLTALTRMDLSFNNLTGELPDVPISDNLKFIFLSGNSLSGKIRESILKKGIDVDLSYNNFTWPSSEQPACREALNLNLNLFRSSPVKSYLKLEDSLLTFISLLDRHSFYINCGGQNVKVNGSTFEGDEGNDGGAATYYLNDNASWGFSSTGDFLDDNDEQNRRYIADSNSSVMSELYKNARIAPISLTYFGYCLENGNYLVTLHFAEILFTDDNTYHSLGRRIFDIYVQDKLVEKDFNIEAEASGVLKPFSKLYNVTIANNILEIRFNWAGKGTTAIPRRGVYGPLVSAISVVDPNFKPEKKNIASIVVGVVVGLCTIVLVLGFLCWRYYVRSKSGKQAVKQLSSKSKQGNREFLNEIGMISCLQHPNLVKLYGCCIEGDQLLLVYEYMENNSLARALFGYMAPEYALWGYLTYKADVYSFGVVALEIASGKYNMSYVPDENCACLLDCACRFQQNGKLKELVDPKLGSEYKEEEAERMIKVSLLCTNASPSIRPTMSEVVGMLEGTTDIPDVIPEAGSYSQDLRFKAIRDQRRLMHNQSLEGSQTGHPTLAGFSTSDQDLYEISEESYLRCQIENKNSVSEVQLSTSMPSWAGSSSTSGRDLYGINSSSK
ncbi:hypothetical protein EZV62_027004 [Acer yangbiense]|uniref:non-specific serine/threonine protein kinase n=1 Tax=Acer yangbiense TaxID=1000413 RepID=A0A5C7GT28_9ROSI|nr:hypothetical protein EZV62_027004 [Acer yangbiense]